MVKAFIYNCTPIDGVYDFSDNMLSGLLHEKLSQNHSDKTELMENLKEITKDMFTVSSIDDYLTVGDDYIDDERIKFTITSKNEYTDTTFNTIIMCDETDSLTVMGMYTFAPVSFNPSNHGLSIDFVIQLTDKDEENNND